MTNRRLWAQCVIACCFFVAVAFPPAPAAFATPSLEKPLPLFFEPNLGQIDDPEARFVSRLPQGDFHVRSDGASLPLRGDRTVRMRFVSASASGSEGGCRLPGVTHVYRSDGADLEAIPHFEDVRIRNVYRGIDVAWHSKNAMIEYDFIIAPGADPRHIRMAFEGADRLQLTNGDLDLIVGDASIRHRKPVAYQVVQGRRREVTASWQLDNGHAMFQLGSYDHTEPLVIDPVIFYSTTLNYVPAGVARDSAQNVIVAGDAQNRVIVAKYDPTLLYAHYYVLMGGSVSASSMTIDSNDNVVVGGSGWGNLPQGVYPSSGWSGDYDAFAVKLNSAGTVVFSGWYGTKAAGRGSSIADVGNAVAVDASGNVFLAGGYGATNDAFLVKWSATGTRSFAIQLSGAANDVAFGVAADSTGNAYVVGQTTSSNFPVSSASDGTFGGTSEAFVTKVSPTGSVLWSTFLGGNSGDAARAIVVDGSDNPHVTGATESSDFATTPGAYATTATPAAGEFVPFATKYTASGGVIWSTLIASQGCTSCGRGEGRVIAIDAAGAVHIAGVASAGGLPVQQPLQAGYGGAGDAYLAKLNDTGSALLFGTYLGGSTANEPRGIAVDSLGNQIVVGPGIFTAISPGTITTALAVNITPAPSLTGQPVTIRATVSATSVPTGTVRFYANGVALGSAPVNASGVAEIVNSSLSRAEHAITAIFDPTGSFAASVASTTHIVRSATTTTLSCPSSTTYGNPVQCTATVSSSDGSVVNESTVLFRTGSESIVSAAVSNGSASMSRLLAARTHFLRADFAGSTSFAPSTSDILEHVVHRANPSISLSAPQTVRYGQRSAVQMTISPTASGGVLSIRDNGATLLTPANLTSSIILPKPGRHALIAEYSGDPNNNPATSAPVDVYVEGDGSTKLDIDGDGRTDVLWRNLATGTIGYWTLNGAAIAGSANIADVPLALTVTGVGDFDGNGKSDILWRDNDGGVAVWLMNGPIIIGGTRFGTVTTRLYAAAVADFDGDGKADIAWRDAISGELGVWLMDGATIKQGALVGAASTSLDFAGAGDFDGDGKADILWHERTNGNVAVWLMNGVSISGGGLVGAADPDLKIATISDLDSDGKSDLVWRHRASGDIGAWLMNGIHVAGGGLIGNAPQSFSVRGSGDTDGDGRGDLLLFHASTGDVGLWRLNGATIIGGAYIGGAPPNWDVQ